MKMTASRTKNFALNNITTYHYYYIFVVAGLKPSGTCAQEYHSPLNYQFTGLQAVISLPKILLAIMGTTYLRKHLKNGSKIAFNSPFPKLIHTMYKKACVFSFVLCLSCFNKACNHEDLQSV